MDDPSVLYKALEIVLCIVGLVMLEMTKDLLCFTNKFPHRRRSLPNQDDVPGGRLALEHDNREHNHHKICNEEKTMAGSSS
ncbi:hypothetical protein JTB14_016331 [Gonioctena quinquepunctata]|nr:hypothetical protein JTB14_016331 [Gonioctena quinquepunctata]